MWTPMSPLLELIVPSIDVLWEMMMVQCASLIRYGRCWMLVMFCFVFLGFVFVFVFVLTFARFADVHYIFWCICFESELRWV